MDRCTRCVLHANTNAVPSSGPVPCDILLVGEAPGAVEEVQGRPFVGTAGQLLDRLLGEAGLPRDSVRVANCVRCRPPGNRTPTKQEIESCKLHLVKEVTATRPQVVIALGGTALTALTGRSGVSDNRGKTLQLSPEFRSNGVRVICTYHPASVLYNRTARIEDKIASDIQTAIRIIHAEESTDIIVVSEHKTQRALRELEKCEVLGCDCEWEVLEKGAAWPWSKRKGKLPSLISISLAGFVRGRGVAVSIPITDEENVRDALKIVSEVPSIYHNAISDIMWIMSMKGSPIVVGDTLLLAALLNVEHGLGLKTLASIYTDITPGWEIGIPLGVIPQTDFEWDRLLRYNAIDALATLKLHDVLLALCQSNGRQKVLPLYKELLKAQVVLSQAALRGIPIDPYYLEKMARHTEVKREQVKARIATELNIPEFYSYDNKDSTKKKVAQALSAKGVEITYTPKSNKPSLRKDTLTPYSHIPVVRDLLTLSAIRKADSAYLAPWIRLINEQGEARIHTIYKLWNTRTGRTATEQDAGGTLQQYPRGKTVRKLIRAPDGYKILSADYSQIELRIAAWQANETTMLRFFREGLDVHKATAAWIKASREASLKEFLSNIKGWIAQVEPWERQNAKPVNFGFLYGMREPSFVEYAKTDYGMDFSLEEAKVMRDGYFTLYPKLVPWHDAAWEWVRRGYVESPLGRRRLLTEEGEFDRHRKAINMPVQATASDMTLAAMVKIDDEVQQYDAYVIGFIHDAILMEIADGCVKEVEGLVRKCMLGQQFDIPVPMEVEIKIDQVWK